MQVQLQLQLQLQMQIHIYRSQFCCSKSDDLDLAVITFGRTTTNNVQ